MVVISILSIRSCTFLLPLTCAIRTQVFLIIRRSNDALYFSTVRGAVRPIINFLAVLTTQPNKQPYAVNVIDSIFFVHAEFKQLFYLYTHTVQVIISLLLSPLLDHIPLPIINYWYAQFITSLTLFFYIHINILSLSLSLCVSFFTFFSITRGILQQQCILFSL